ncbi:uncharacterized protein [Setaria viridis]|uniref:uncharacterized protein n=1 Tax=Setaria viridis TaxID=4556 RepID=UPI003B3AD909
MAPEDKIYHEKLAQRSANYVIVGKEIYRKAASTGILMKCILRSESIERLHEIHSGTCGNHAASGTLVGKAFHSGFYWPTMIEVKAVTSIESAEATQFVEEIMHRFGVPNRIITDLDAQFLGSEFWDVYQDNLIEVYYSSLAYPRYNGQVKHANRMVLQSLKSRIFDDTSKYAAKWLHVAFGAPRIQYYEEGELEKSRQVDMDNLEENRVAALIQHARHEQQIRRYYDRNVRKRSFNVSDLVLLRVQSTKDMHKLAATWEDPFIVKEVIKLGTY